jgi:hypothetical protein
VKRLAPSLAAAVLLVLAATGLSSLANDDHCFTHGPAVNEESYATGSAPIVLWPPGRQCRYESASGAVTTEDLGDIAGFTIMLAGGAFFWGGCAALVATRSLIATATGG